MSYFKWQKRCVIAKLPTVAARRAELTRLGLNSMEPTAEDEGYYRIPKTVKDASGNGKNIITGYTPVALFIDEGNLVGVIGPVGPNGGAAMDPAEIIDRWTWMCGYPISYELYKAVAERGEPWPDLGDTTPAQAAAEAVREELTPTIERVIERDHNQPPEVLPEVAAAESIDNAIGAAKGLPVTTVDEAAIAGGAANVIRERRLAVEKIAKAKVTPLQLAYEAERNKYLPLVKRAKEAEDAVRAKVAAFEAAERRRVAAEQLAALEKQQAIDEAAARAADRAIAAGQPEAQPVVEEVVIPQAPERVTPTYGSYKPREVEKWHFDGVENFDALYASIKDTEELRAVLTALAEKMVKAGRDVPGVKRHWGVI